MHSMVIQMSIDPSRTDLVTRHFREDIIGWARQQPGFVSGQWLLSPGQKQGMGVVVFATEDAAATAARGPRSYPARQRPGLEHRRRDRVPAGHLRVTPPRRGRCPAMRRTYSAQASQQGSKTRST